LPKIKLKYVEKPSWKKLEENFGNLKEMDRGHEGDFAFTMAEVLFDKMIHCGYNVRLMDDWVYDFDNECYLLPLLSTKDYKTIPHNDIYQVVTTIQVHNKKKMFNDNFEATKNRKFEITDFSNTSHLEEKL